ncbi:hypothetical protein INT47_001109 [Mucor saturninus]|uniref:Uncharacterized protein n=1 Tax=Mucor saturninus TaxID=64648 RepID=A0A8H7RNR3_9FUNG|nr:hypothetical protein INT47_001109 [Mucor saturninus]
MKYEENYKTIPESREAHADELQKVYEIIKMRPYWGYEDPDNYHKRFLFLVLCRPDTVVAQFKGDQKFRKSHP